MFDGMGVCDYIYVVDFVCGYLLVFDILCWDNCGFIVNFGMGCGYLVLEVVEVYKCVSGKLVLY